MIEMVIYTSLQTSRTEGTADIDIKTGLEEEGAKFANGDRLHFRRTEH